MAPIQKNPPTPFRPESVAPHIDPAAFVHPLAAVIGDVRIGAEVFVAPGAVLRADEGSPFVIGACSNVQDGVVLHALETHGAAYERNTMEVGGVRSAIFVGERVSLAHQAQLHGPVCVGDDTFVGMQAFLFRTRIGAGCVIEPGAKVMGVSVEDDRYVKTGSIVTTQEQADALPVIDENYPFRDLNVEVVKVNCDLARAYRRET